jgi:hypothetical protein
VASAQEAIVARERVKDSIKEAKAQATLAKREARERVLKVEVESAFSLALFAGGQRAHSKGCLSEG